MKEYYQLGTDNENFDNPWEDFESYGTTGQFQRVDGRIYLRNCGPTAVTNLIRTLKLREQKESPDTASAAAVPSSNTELFDEVARLGEHVFTYYNADLLGHFGGTSDVLAIFYLMAALKKYGSRAKVKGCHLMSDKAIREALDRGSILYIELRNHPKYKNHHIICYSAKTVERYVKRWHMKKQLVLSLRCADGWVPEPTYLSTMAISPLSTFIEIGWEK